MAAREDEERQAGGKEGKCVGMGRRGRKIYRFGRVQTGRGALWKREKRKKNTIGEPRGRKRNEKECTLR